MTSPHITLLPLELVHKIASFCPINDLVALGDTCRHLHSTCNDSFVLQEAFFCHVADKTTLRKLLVDRLSFESPAEARAIWRRLAAATSQLPRLINELETHLLPYESVPWDNSKPRPGLVAPQVRDIIGTLSTLTVLGHPTVNDFAVTASLTGLTARLLDPEFWGTWDPNPSTRLTLATQLSFCLATGAIGNHVLNNMPLLRHRVASLWMPDSPEYSILKELRNQFEGDQTIAMLVIACLVWMLRSDITVRLRDDLPSPAALPLLNVAGRRGSQLPLPNGTLSVRVSPLADGPDTQTLHPLGIPAFAVAASWTAWLRSNVDALVDDLSRGEWTGYSTSSLSRGGDVYAPLQNIHFVTQQDPDDPDEMKLTADGCVDAIGRFSIHGVVSRSTAKVSFMKRYIGAHIWYNEGTLTPLGISGYWGGYPSRPSGFFWMYKKEWARKEPRV